MYGEKILLSTNKSMYTSIRFIDTSNSAVRPMPGGKDTVNVPRKML